MEDLGGGCGALSKMSSRESTPVADFDEGTAALCAGGGAAAEALGSGGKGLLPEAPKAGVCAPPVLRASNCASKSSPEE